MKYVDQPTSNKEYPDVKIDSTLTEHLQNSSNFNQKEYCK